MKIRTSLLAVIASVVLLGCTTPPGRDRPSGATGEQPLALGKPAPKMREESPFSQFFVGKPAPFTADTDSCSAASCSVQVDVTDVSYNKCTVKIVNPVLSLEAKPPRPRVIVWFISDANHVFPPLGSDPPALVTNKTPDGSYDPAFGTPAIVQGFMKVQFDNYYPRLSHQYGLNVTKTDGTKCDPYDPWVIE